MVSLLKWKLPLSLRKLSSLQGWLYTSCGTVLAGYLHHGCSDLSSWWQTPYLPASLQRLDMTVTVPQSLAPNKTLMPELLPFKNKTQVGSNTYFRACSSGSCALKFCIYVYERYWLRYITFEKQLRILSSFSEVTWLEGPPSSSGVWLSANSSITGSRVFITSVMLWILNQNWKTQLWALAP